MMTMVVICHAHLVGSPFERACRLSQNPGCNVPETSETQVGWMGQDQRRTSCNKRKDVVYDTFRTLALVSDGTA
jgi:hypothetical protein